MIFDRRCFQERSLEGPDFSTRTGSGSYRILGLQFRIKQQRSRDGHQNMCFLPLHCVSPCHPKHVLFRWVRRAFLRRDIHLQGLPYIMIVMRTVLI